MLSCRGENRLRVKVKLLLGVCGNNHRHDGKHHALVACSQIIKKLFRLFALELHIIRNDSAEVVVLILLSLPVGDVGLDAKQSIFNLSDCFIRRDRNYVDGQHEVSVQLGKLGKHTVLDIARIVFKKQNPCKLLTDFDMIRTPLHAVRADIIAEIVPHTSLLIDVHFKGRLIAGAIEVMEDAEPLHRIKRHTLGAESRKVGCQICTDSGEVGPCLLNVLFAHGDGHILLLRNAICSGGLVQKHIVILHPVAVQTVALHRHEDRVLKICFVQSVIVDGDLCGSAAVKAVQEFRVGQEHTLLIFTACHHIVDVAEPVGLGKFVSNLENPVRPDALDRDKVLNLFWHNELLFILSEDSFDALNHCLCRPPFPWRQWCPSTPRSRCSPARI